MVPNKVHFKERRTTFAITNKREPLESAQPLQRKGPLNTHINVKRWDFFFRSKRMISLKERQGEFVYPSRMLI